MKRDYYSDVRTTQRIILESSLYVLSNLDKKVDSFTSQRTVYVMRQRERNELLHPDNILQSDASRPLPALNQIANDLSRPLGSRIPLLNPFALCKVPGYRPSTQKKQSNNLLKKLVLQGLERFKNEHEDEGSLTLQLGRIAKCYCDSDQLSKIEEFILDLFKKFIVFAQRELRQSNQPRQKVRQIQLAYNLLSALIQRNQETQQLLRQEELVELITFIGTVDRELKGCLQCKKGPILISYWPEVQYLSLVVHPVLLTLHSCIKEQVKAQEKKFQSNDAQNNPQAIKEDILFQQIASHNCSRITFINLDGHDSPLNLLLSKCLSKHVQYVSFPLQCSQYFSKTSVIQDTPDFWAHQAKYFKVKQQSHKDHLQTYKRLLVFPLGFEQGPQFVDILPYASTFVSFIMQEIVYNQIRDFNPTLIVISHSGRISLQSKDFEQLIRQCSLICNMRVMLYNNLDYDVRSSYMSTSSFVSMNSVRQQEKHGFGLLNELLQKNCMFLKISSGSVSLDRSYFQQTKQQKYSKFKILGYAYNLLRIISPHHPALQHLKNRFIEYRNRQLLYSNFFQNHTLKPTQYSLYHKTLVNAVNALFPNPNSDFVPLVAMITRKYGRHIQEHWKNFLFHYALSITTAQQKETVKYIVRFPHTFKMGYQQAYDLIALEFEIANEQGETAISISPDSQILISQPRRGPVASVFLLNHMPNHNHPTLVNYVGIIDSSIENSCEKRVALKEVELKQRQYEVGPHQHFCQFNFVETEKHVILFWPLLYDQRAALLHSFAKVKYYPPITNLIFVGSKVNPTYLTSIQPISSGLITPRSGCTCYQPSNSQKIIIFGGFYNGLRNYLQFQTDITVFQITLDQTFLADNIPRSFYLTNREGGASGSQIVTAIHNDFVRPRVEYQIYEKSRNNQFVEIILLGGVGEKYVRPYSILSQYGHQIMLHNDSIVSIKRIKLNNVVPANLKEPVRSKQETATLTICSAQNRRLTTEKRPSRPHSLSFLAFTYRYSSEEQRMLWTKNYEVGLIENRSEWESLSLKDYDKQSIVELTYKGIHQSKVLISVEDGQGSRKMLLNLAYELDEQQAQQFVNLDVKIIPLSAENILAIDISGAIIYALIQHPMYTYGHPILVRSDFYTRQQLQQFQDNQHIPLRQIYCFDRKLNNHIIKVIEGDKIGILHGCHFNPKILFPEVILKKDKTGFFYCQEVEPSIISSEILIAAQEKNDFSSAVSKISFLYGHRGKFMCFSWLGLQNMVNNVEQFLLLVDQLPGEGEVLDWKLKFHGRLKLRFQENPISDLQHKEIIDMVEQLGEQENRIYRFGVKYGDYLFRGSFILDNLHDGDSVPMEVIKNQATVMREEQYKLERLKQYKNVQYGQYIDKGPSSKFSSTEIDVQQA